MSLCLCICHPGAGEESARWPACQNLRVYRLIRRETPESTRH